ncbi:TPA: type IV secretion system protein [Legionella pneumophila]|nr:type IV secretion system protein [Legionella pneumophila]HAU4041833.1 type IV secretion system protein [Legionella pneumophila]HAU4054647.1 type IV secretion system protein [Legionella pneumophila]HDU8241981.1 type IV secretion system protein [Legionella pneumophila]HDU8251521.1 type IV secretion system protein [Legionella pneumophila]
MSTTTYNNFMIQLANELDSITRTFVFDGYGALSSVLQAPLASLIVLYIILKGYAVARGLIEQPQQELFRFSIRVGLIYLFAMNWDFFSSHVCDLFISGSETIATKLMLAIHKHGLGNSINQGLQNVLNEISMLGCDLFEAGSLRKLTPYFAGMMVFLSGSITVGFAFIEIVIAKLMMAVLLCTAPLFILFTLFEQTKSFFERWLGVLAGFSFVLILVSSVVGLCVHLLHWVTSSFTTNDNPVTAAIWIPIFIVACLCVMGIMQAVNIGKSIGGSVCTSNGAAMVGGLIAGSLGAGGLAKKAMNKARKGSSSGASSLIQGGKQTTHAATNLFKQLHKNLRRGA